MVKSRRQQIAEREQAFIEAAENKGTSTRTSTSTSTSASTNYRPLIKEGLDPDAPRHKGTNLKMNQYEYELFQRAVALLKQENSKANMADLIRSAALEKAIEIVNNSPPSANS